MKRLFLLLSMLTLLSVRVIAADSNLNQHIIVECQLEDVIQAMQTYYYDPNYHGNAHAVTATNEVPGVSYTLSLADCAFDPSIGGILAEMVASRDTADGWTTLNFVVKSQYSKDFNTASLRQTISKTLYGIDTLAEKIADSTRKQFKQQFEDEMLPKVGQKIVYVGTVEVGKPGPYITADHRGGIYIEETTTNAADFLKANKIGSLERHRLRVEGILHHREQSPLVVIDGITAQGTPEHFFFDVAEISYSEVKEPGH